MLNRYYKDVVKTYLDNMKNSTDMRELNKHLMLKVLFDLASEVHYSNFTVEGYKDRIAVYYFLEDQVYTPGMDVNKLKSQLDFKGEYTYVKSMLQKGKDGKNEEVGVYELRFDYKFPKVMGSGGNVIYEEEHWFPRIFFFLAEKSITVPLEQNIANSSIKEYYLLTEVFEKDPDELGDAKQTVRDSGKIQTKNAIESVAIVKKSLNNGYKQFVNYFNKL